jgi:hypothetical protein
VANKPLNEINEQHSTLLMLGYLCVKDIEGLAEKIEVLDRFGLADVDISIICAREVQSIRNTRVKIKSKKPGN